MHAFYRKAANEKIPIKLNVEIGEKIGSAMLFLAHACVMLPLCEGFCIVESKRLFLVSKALRNNDNRFKAGKNRHHLPSGHNFCAFPAFIFDRLSAVDNCFCPINHSLPQPSHLLLGRL